MSSFKKRLTMLLAFVMLFSISTVSSFASNDGIIVNIANGIQTTDEFGNTIVEIPIAIDKSVVDVETLSPPTQMEPNHWHISPHTHSIENISTYLINDFYPVTSYSTASSVSYSMGSSFSISASISTSVGVTEDIVTTTLGGSVTGSSTITADQTYTFNIPSGYKGRIVYRYSYDYYTFDCVTYWYLTGDTDRGDGSARSKPHDDASAYFTLQLVEI